MGSKSGFSLVEIMIVVVLLAILAVLALPYLVNASEGARESALARCIQIARKQIELYKLQHGGRGPHLDHTGSLDKARLVARMTGRTDPGGKLDPNGALGPYMGDWPLNPFSLESVAGEVLFGKATKPPRDGTTGWYYSTITCLLSANSKTGGESFDPDGKTLGPAEGEVIPAPNTPSTIIGP